MVDHKTNDETKKDCCNKDNKSVEKKLVKATELPIHGNPFPPKDVIQVEKPNILEVKIGQVRSVLQPYVSPVASVYEKTSDVLSIGVAHSQSAMQRLAQNQSSVLNAIIISGAGLLGVGLARRRGVFKKLLYGSVFFGGAMAACYPKDAEEKAQLTWYIMKNKLPDVAKQQYEKLTGVKAKQPNTEPKEVEK